MSSVLWFQASGKNYRPSLLPFHFTRQHDSGEIKLVGKDAGTPYPYGFSEFRVPDELPWDEKVSKLIQYVEPMIASIKETGATCLNIQALIYGGTSTIDFTAKELSRFASLECGLTLTCYSDEKA